MAADAKFVMDRDAVAKVAQQCNMSVSLVFYEGMPLTVDVSFSKRDSANLAQEQSAHLYLCVLVSDLTQRYGPVIRPAKVVGVLDAAFDVLVPEFGIEKRVHIDQMPIEVRMVGLALKYLLSFTIRITSTRSTRTRCRSTGRTRT